MDEQGAREVRVPAFYCKLEDPEVFYRFDGSPEAWAWAGMQRVREKAIIQAAGILIAVYSEIGSYPSTGENFYLVSRMLSRAGWGDEEELEAFLATHRADVEREVREETIYGRRSQGRAADIDE
jgi:hypothetical protein